MVEHRFERDGIVSIAYNGDCMEGMKMFDDRRFDLACVDPPYGIDIANMRMGAGKSKKASNIKNRKWKPKCWDKNIPPKEYFKELFRVSKNQIIWGGNYFGLPPTRCFLVWDKGEGFYNRSYAECELAWTSFNANTTKIKYDPLARGDYKGKIHPTQKPVQLYKWLLQNYAKEGDLILDTHLGSQSSRIAAYEAGLNFIGFELDEDYFKQGCDRFDWHVKQLKLF